MKLGVVGCGYVGLVTATCFAHLGNEVIGADVDEDKIAKLSSGEPTIYEPGLDEMLKEQVSKGNLKFTTDVAKAIRESDVIFICVGTPQLPDGRADLSQVEQVARIVAENLNGYKLIVEKSTVPVKTSNWIKRTIKLYAKTDAQFDVASNPEFLKEGSAINDFLYPDRIVIGVESEKAKEILLKLYEPIDCPKLVTDVNTAEIIKHASNSFLAMKISFINMVADLCEKTGADIQLVADGMGMDKRIGREFLNAGIGYGGSCFPKDVRAFTKIAEEFQVDFSLLKEVDKINNERIDAFLKKIKNALWILSDKTIAVWGLAFKPNTDDIREAPSIKVIQKLLEESSILKLYDPQAMENTKKLFPPSERVSYHPSAIESAKNADAILVITEWQEFKDVNLKELKNVVKTPIIIDGRNIFNPEDMKKYGFEYYPIGRSSVKA